MVKALNLHPSTFTYEKLNCHSGSHKLTRSNALTDNLMPANGPVERLSATFASTLTASGSPLQPSYGGTRLKLSSTLIVHSMPDSEEASDDFPTG